MMIPINCLINMKFPSQNQNELSA